MKINISDLSKVLSDNGIDKTKIPSIISAAEALATLNKEEKGDGLPKRKNEFLVAMFESDIKENKPLAYVLTQKEGEDSDLVLGRLSDAAREFNGTKKGKKRPILTFGDLFPSIKRKFVKNQEGGINIKTTEQVRVLVIKENKLV